MWNVLVAICSLVLLLFVAIRSYMKLTNGKCRSKEKMEGKTVLITGSDKGIGYETALDLAKRQARIIMACRDIGNARNVAEEIKLTTGNNQVIAKKLDVSCLADVKKFAEDFMKEERHLHVLILNAGIPFLKRSELIRTTEGFELVFATNYLGHFLLTMLLMDLLKKSQPSRIISVSSLLHNYAPYPDVTDLNSEKTSQPLLLYNKSKLLQILFTKELSRQLQDTNVTANCLHPGVVRTNIFGKFPEPIRTLSCFVTSLLSKTPKEGAQTTIHLAVSKEVEGVSGLYFSDCKPKTPSTKALDGNLAKKVFEASERYCEKFLENGNN